MGYNIGVIMGKLSVTDANELQETEMNPVTQVQAGWDIT